MVDEANGDVDCCNMSDDRDFGRGGEGVLQKFCSESDTYRVLESAPSASENTERTSSSSINEASRSINRQWASGGVGGLVRVCAVYRISDVARRENSK